MLSIAKLRVGQEAYQLTGVAQSLDDYYTGAGEAPGVWAGVGAERLGLAGEVSGDDLRAVLAGMAPNTGGMSPNGDEIRAHPRRVPGFDLTFKVPKSVSVLYAVSDDPRAQGAIIEAGDAAVRAALGWLEREAIHVRRGSGDARWLADLAVRDPEAAERARVRIEPASGVVAAMFRHRTSRAGDPLLHWHTLVANLAEGPDGRWSAFVHPDLYWSVRAAGEVFQTVLRAELSARLGLEWSPGRHVPEVAGVPQRLCDVFSKRSKEIEAWLESTGTPADADGRQAAVLATRRGKPEVEGERFDVTWKAEALDAGWGPDAAEALLAGLTPSRERGLEEMWRLPEWSFDDTGTPVFYDRVVEPDEWVQDLLRRDLTVEDSTFTRSQLVEAIATRLGDGATITTLDRVVARTLASSELVPVHEAVQDPNSNPGPQRWTSAELVGVERALLASLDESRGTRSVLPRALVDDAIASRASLGDDQATAVRVLATSRDGVGVLVGPAGTGKTFTLDAVRAAYETAGYRVIGAAPSARAALELEAGAGIPSETMQRLYGEWSRGFDGPDSRTVLVIDEAGMAATRDLEALVTPTVRAGGRVILSGDHHQLPEVGAGGGFATAVARGGTGVGGVAVLTVNRRQHEPWERDALEQLRDQHVPAAVAAYRDHGRVIVTPDRESMLAVAVNRWFDAHADGLHPVLLAGTNEMVDALNQAVRRQLAERGLLVGEPVGRWAGRDFVAGDRVVLRSNSYRERTVTGEQTAVLNGQSGTVLAGNPAQLVVRLDRDDTTVELGESYLRSGWVDHGYALTSHRAQGGTWDLAIAVGTDGLYREAAYVQLSRGRNSNWLVVTAPELADIDTKLDEELDRHDHGIPLPDEHPDDVDEDLHRRLHRSRAKLLALARDPHADHIATLATQSSVAALETRAVFARRVERQATDVTGINPRTVGAAVARAQHTAAHVAVGQQVKAHDRHNIGTVTAIDDAAATVTVQFSAANGHHTVRDLRWDLIEIVTPHNPDPRPLPETVHARLEQIIEPARGAIERWHGHLARHGVHPLDATHNERAAELIIDRAAANLAARQPDWLNELLGPRPGHALPAQVWDQTVHEIAALRTRHDLPDTTPGLGPIPDDPHQQNARDRVSDHVGATRVWLDTYDTSPTIAGSRTRSTIELEVRREALDDIFDTAPADQRDFITALRADGQLPLEDTAELLREALATQGARRDWILAHWPHVVEYAEISRTLEQRSAGPHTTTHLETLAAHTDPALADAAIKNEPWLHAALSQLVTADAHFVDEEAVLLLGRVASFRQRWQITHTDPLGVAASIPEQAVERAALVTAITATRAHVRSLDQDAQPHLAEEILETDAAELSYWGGDDGLGL